MQFQTAQSGYRLRRGHESPTLHDNRVVLFPLLCGLFNQSNLLPLRFLQGLQIELEVVNQFTGCCLGFVDRADFGFELDTVSENLPDMSTAWAISEAQVKCSVIELDSQLDNRV